MKFWTRIAAGVLLGLRTTATAKVHALRAAVALHADTVQGGEWIPGR
jgi:hypothetical protein